MRPLLLFIIIIWFYQLAGVSFAQSTYRMDRYTLDADQVNALTLEFQNSEFAFNRLDVGMAYPEMTSSIDKITVNSANSESDLWLTSDSVLFFSSQNTQTAWIKKQEQKIQIAFMRNILPNETVKIFLNLRLYKSIQKYEKKSADVPVMITVHHSNQPFRKNQFFPAVNITIKP